MKIGEIDIDFNITEGAFTITEERAKHMSFSNHIHSIGTSLVIRSSIKLNDVK